MRLPATSTTPRPRVNGRPAISPQADHNPLTPAPSPTRHRASHLVSREARHTPTRPCRRRLARLPGRTYPLRARHWAKKTPSGTARLAGNVALTWYNSRSVAKKTELRCEQSTPRDVPAG